MARPNGVRELWNAGKPVINSWLGVPSSFSAEVMANAGWDSLVVDMQHGMIDYQMMVTMLQGISTTNTTPLVRVPWNDPAYIQKALDAGSRDNVTGIVIAFDEGNFFGSQLEDIVQAGAQRVPVSIVFIDFQHIVVQDLDDDRLRLDILLILRIRRRRLRHQRIQPLRRQRCDHHENDEQHQENIDQRNNVH